jgi:phosphate transport system substrate-binding protein
MNRIARAALVLALVIFVASCTKKNEPPPTPAKTQVNGGGSTFVYPIMSKWAEEYAKSKENAAINYQALGSGAGIRQVSEGTVDFGATDGPMSDEQLAQSKVGAILHVPIIMGATVAAYNLPEYTGELKLTPSALANIFLGKITKWNDPAIARSNPGQTLPATGIVVVHRSDGSGTTYIWTDYLSKVNPAWKAKVGTNTSVEWPKGVGAKGNDGVAGMVKQTPGALGYVEMTYADQNNIPYASIQNASGAFIRPSPEGVTAAAASAKIPDDFRYSLTNPAGKDAYPIAGTVWLLIPANPTNAEHRAVVVDFANWILTSGQEFAPALHYSKLPPELVSRVQQSLGAPSAAPADTSATAKP